MKNTIFYFALIIGILFSGIANGDNDNDTTKFKKHVKTIVVKDGETFKFDSCFTQEISADEIEVIIQKAMKEQGIDAEHKHSTNKGNAMIWISDDEKNEETEVTIESTDNDSIKVFVMKKALDGKKMKSGNSSMFYSFGDENSWTSKKNEDIDVNVETIGDSIKVMVIASDDGNIKKEIIMKDLKAIKDAKKLNSNDMHFFHNFDHKMPETNFFHERHSKLIDLNDPNIISFEREELKGGKEKITIIRKKKE